MSRILNYILGALALFLLIMFIAAKCSDSKHIKENASLKNELFACQNAPVKSDTVFIYDTIVEYKYIKPKPSSKPNDEPGLPSVTTTGCDNTKAVYYSETFSKQGAKIHWEALTGCENDSAIIQYIRFPEIIVPKEIITNTKTVTVEKKVEVPAKIRSKFMVYGGTFANNLSSFPGLELGMGYLHKQAWGITAGPMYNDKKVYGSLKVFVTF